MIQIKNQIQIAAMKEAGRITGEALLVAREMVREGISTFEIDMSLSFCSNLVTWYQRLNLNKITMTVHWPCPLMPNECTALSVSSKFIMECYSSSYK